MLRCVLVSPERIMTSAVAELTPARVTHLKALEAESIHIIREVAAEFSKPVMLYSIGKDSSVMLRLAQKAFYPGPLPFPLMHIDTRYKFREMIEFRDTYPKSLGTELLVVANDEAIRNGTNPFNLGTQKCCAILKTGNLLNGLKLTDSTRRLAVRGAMRRNRAPRSAFTHSAMPSASGTLATSVPNCGTCITPE